MAGFLFFYFIGLVHATFWLCLSSAPDDACSTVADIVLALDTTTEMKQHEKPLTRSLPFTVRELSQQFKASRFGLVTFNDEDTRCLTKKSTKDNYGVRVEQPLTDNVGAMHAAISGIKFVFGDRFEPEDSMGALLMAALHSRIGWRRHTSGYRRMVVVITDARYRIPKDRKSFCSKRLIANDGDGIYDHTKEGPPTDSVVQKVLKDQNIIPIFIVPNNPEGTNNWKIYSSFLEKYELDGLSVPVTNANLLVSTFKETIQNIICKPFATPTPTIIIPTPTIPSIPTIPKIPSMPTITPIPPTTRIPSTTPIPTIPRNPTITPIPTIPSMPTITPIPPTIRIPGITPIPTIPRIPATTTTTEEFSSGYVAIVSVVVCSIIVFGGSAVLYYLLNRSDSSNNPKLSRMFQPISGHFENESYAEAEYKGQDTGVGINAEYKVLGTSVGFQ